MQGFCAVINITKNILRHLSEVRIDAGLKVGGHPHGEKRSRLLMRIDESDLRDSKTK